MNIIRDFNLITIKDGNLKTSYEEHNQNTNSANLITIENKDGIHADLDAALQRLAVHIKQLLNMPLVIEMTVTGYYKQNSGNAQLITFFSKLGSEGKANLSSRFLLGKDKYPYLEELLKALSVCEREAELCIQGKAFNTDRPVVVDDIDLILMQKPKQVIAQC